MWLSEEDKTMLDIQLESVDGGTLIKVVRDGTVTDEATVYDGITPTFKVENDGLYVSYDENNS